jgi:hypothetical protein
MFLFDKNKTKKAITETYTGYWEATFSEDNELTKVQYSLTVPDEKDVVGEINFKEGTDTEMLTVEVIPYTKD